MISKLGELKNFILSEEKGIANKNTQNISTAIRKTKTSRQRKTIIESQISVLENEIKLHDKIIIIINAFINKNVYSADVEKDAYYESKEPEFEESIEERVKTKKTKKT